jgi:hypothetical protein
VKPINPLQNIAFLLLVIIYHMVIVAGLVTSDTPGRTTIVAMYLLNLAIYQIQPHRQAPSKRDQ